MDYEQVLPFIPNLRRYARALVGDRDAADDLVQDTLERACTRLAQWRPGSDLAAWAFTIMHNLFVSEMRRPRYRLETAQELAAEAGEGTDAAPDPAAGWADALDLERALRALPQAQRQVLLLVAFEDMSYEQVAAVVGVPTGTVMSRLSRARTRLRELLEPAGDSRPAGPRLRLMK